MTLNEFLTDFGAFSTGSLVATFGATLIGGMVASAVCPCTLPVGLGLATVAGAAEGESKRSGIMIAVAFFVGIVVNLVLLGAIAGRLGQLATESFGRGWTLIMAVISFVAAGAAFYGPRLNVAKLATLRRPGLGGSFVYGFIFSLGTSVAPLLLLLAIAAGQASIQSGVLLALVFGIGRGLPFLIVGLAASAATRFTSLGRWRRSIQVVSGLALLTVGIYYAQAFAALL